MSANNPSNQHLLTNQSDNTKLVSGSLEFNEPLSSSTRFNINYTYDQSQVSNIINTGIINRLTQINSHADSLSDIYNSKYLTNTGSLSFRTVDNKATYTYGINVINTALTGKFLLRDSATNYPHLNFDAAVRFAYTIDDKSSFTVDYKGKSISPSFLELEPVRDISNPQNEMIGNPGLKPEFYHTLKIQYNTVNHQTHSSFFSNVDFNLVQNKIISDRLAMPNSIIQQTTFINATGYKSIRAFYSLTQSLKKDHSHLRCQALVIFQITYHS